MTDPSDPPVPGQALTVTEADDAPLPYDPAEYRWVPVRRVPRRDGWTEEKQRRFIETLADTGLVRLAAKEVGMTRESAYRLRRAAHAAAFARAWDDARRHGAGLIEERQVKHAPGMFQARPGDGPTCRWRSTARSRASRPTCSTRTARSPRRASSTTTAC